MHFPITREQRVQGLRHPNLFVRSSLLSLFSEHLDPDPAVSAAVIQTIGEHGWNAAFQFTHQAASLCCDESVAAWIAEEITRVESTTDLKDTRGRALMEWLCQAPIDFLQERFEALLDGLSQKGQQAMRQNPALARSTGHIQHRLELHRKSPEECFDLLEEELENGDAQDDFPEAEIQAAWRICERLLEEPDNLADKVLGWLDFDEKAELGLAHWRAGLGIQLAGRLGLESATDRLIDLYSNDWDWWNELIPRSFLHMKSVAARNRIVERFPDLEWHDRLFLTAALEDFRPEGGDQDLIPLLQNEEDGLIQTNLAMSLAAYGTEQSLAVAREFFLEDTSDPERFEIACVMHAIRRVAGDDHPELEVWHDEMKRQELGLAQAQKRFESLALPQKTAPREEVVSRGKVIPSGRKSIREQPKVGRNEPCPCGSGKKYKKCYLGKDE